MRAQHITFNKAIKRLAYNLKWFYGIYQQTDGVAMGTPLGPLIANIFKSFHEKSWLHNCPSAFKPLVYRRYVDDCFLLFKSFDHVPLFLNYLNHRHSNISFTSEQEKKGKLPFLDIEISRSKR